MKVQVQVFWSVFCTHWKFNVFFILFMFFFKLNPFLLLSREVEHSPKKTSICACHFSYYISATKQTQQTRLAYWYIGLRNGSCIFLGVLNIVYISLSTWRLLREEYRATFLRSSLYWKAKKASIFKEGKISDRTPAKKSF